MTTQKMNSEQLRREQARVVVLSHLQELVREQLNFSDFAAEDFWAEMSIWDDGHHEYFVYVAGTQGGHLVEVELKGAISGLLELSV